MTRTLGLLAVLGILGYAPAASAQFVPGGITITSSGRGLRVGGYVPFGTAGLLFGPPMYGTMQRRVVIQQVMAAPVPRPVAPDYDLSGIDLDVQSPDRLYPPGAGPPKKAERLPEPRKVSELPKPPEPPAKQDLPVPPVKPPTDDLWQPRAGAVEESQRLVELGKRAFRAQEYGLAAMRFRQASAVNPANSKAFLLLAQAYLAVGQYRDAVRAIQEGLKLDPDWPARDFQPRIELYAGADDWIEHRQRLTEAAKRQPKEASFAFLRAYAAWFDDERPQAVVWFLAARVLALDPRWIDLFLKRAPGPVVAAR
jgi:hypothetical protein